MNFEDNCDSAAQAVLAVIERVRTKLPDLFTKTEASRQIKERVSAEFRRLPPEVYERDSVSFNQAYFVLNLYKCCVALQHYSARLTKLSSPVFDVGAGAGPFAIAWKLMINSAAECVVYDTSLAQLSLARRVLTELELTNISYVQADVFSREQARLRMRLSSGIILYSYFWCDIDFLSSSIEESFLGSRCVVVDYKETIDALLVRCPTGFRGSKVQLVARPCLPLRLVLDKDQVNVSIGLFERSEPA